MEEVITTLPFSPRREASIGYYSVPVLADIISSLTGMRAMHAINVIGMKQTAKQDVETHFSILERLNVSTKFQWQDNDEPWGLILSKLLHRGFTQGWVTVETKAVVTCPCGKVEFLSTTSTLAEIHGIRKLYEVRDGVVFCLLCKSTCMEHVVPCLLVRLPMQAPQLTVVPEYAQAEWNQLEHDISSRELLISRIRNTGICAEVVGATFNIDVDFAWKLFLGRIYARGFYCSGIIVGHKTAKHALSVVMLGALLGIPAPRFVISTPYLSLDFGSKLPASAEELIKRHGAAPLRWLLGMALGSAQKEITLESRMIHLIEHSIDPSQGNNQNTSETFSGETIWQKLKGQPVQNILTKLRRGQLDRLTSFELGLANVLGLNPKAL